MGEVKWIKLVVNMFNSSRKIKYIENMTDGDTILIIWIKLLCLAGDINDGGLIYITPDVPFDTEALADELRREVKVVERALDTFIRFGMIERDDEGFIQLCSWEKHQNIEGMEKIKEQTRERVAKHRQRKRAEECNVTCNVTVTQCNAIEEEKEEDKEKEKEFHSFILSRESEEEGEEKKLNYIGGTLGKGVVMLSDEQIEDLLEQLSLDEFNKYVERVADCELSGKHYKKKTHYQAILDMAMKDRKAGRK